MMTKKIIEIPKSVRAKDVGRLQSMDTQLHISVAAPRTCFQSEKKERREREPPSRTRASLSSTIQR